MFELILVLVFAVSTIVASWFAATNRKNDLFTTVVMLFIALVCSFGVIAGTDTLVRDSVEQRWAEHNECVDGETVTNNNLIIVDCDGYYELPTLDN